MSSRSASAGSAWSPESRSSPRAPSRSTATSSSRAPGAEAADSLTYASFGDAGTREFFTHVRFHKHDEERIIVHLLVELYARSEDEAIEVLEGAARGSLEITSLAEESRPPAHASGEAH